MTDIIMHNRLDMKPIIEDSRFAARRIVSLSIGNDENVYALFADAQGRPGGVRYGAMVLQLEWQTGELLSCHPVEFDVVDSNIHFIQPIHGNYLLVCARSRYIDRMTFDKNAMIFGENGQLLRQFCLGDGIEQCMVNHRNQIITGYFDEGIFGNYGWTDPIGKHGLAVWSDDGHKVWENGKYPIHDSYAVNLGDKDDLWFYYYSDYKLVKTDLKSYSAYQPNVSDVYNFMFNRAFTSVLFFYRKPEAHGNAWVERCCCMRFQGEELTGRQECRLTDDCGREIKPVFMAVRKSKAVFWDRSNMLYNLDWV